MHVAKTSGTALAQGLLEAVAPDRPVTGFDRVMFGGFTRFASLSPEVLATIHDAPGSLPADADFVHGHFSLATSRQRYPAAQFITMLREPRVRLLSLWRYWRMQTAATMPGWGDWVDVVARSQAPLEHFLGDRVIACQTDNMILRMLLWPHPLVPDDDFIEPGDDAALLAEAAGRLDRFDLVDVVENDRLATDLEQWLGRPLVHRRLNESGLVSGSVPLERELSDAAFDRLRARSRLDAGLWERIVLQRMPGHPPDRLAERTLLRAVARYGG